MRELEGKVQSSTENRDLIVSYAKSLPTNIFMILQKLNVTGK